MSDDSRTRSGARELTRRSFLRGSALITVGLGLDLAPALVVAQVGEQQPEKKKDDQQKKEKEQEKEQEKPKEKEKEEEKDKEKPSETGDKNAPPEDPTKVTQIDENGREYRVCPQCGAPMYRQDRTWTCETCGFSYVE